MVKKQREEEQAALDAQMEERRRRVEEWRKKKLLEQVWLYFGRELDLSSCVMLFGQDTSKFLSLLPIFLQSPGPSRCKAD